MDMMAAEGASAIDQLRAQGMQAATELQDVKDETMMMQLPPGKYSKGALQTLTKALNKALEYQTLMVNYRWNMSKLCSW
jgi:hypothetical protein